ncbi:hypothetical protein MAPG_11459 [Magnaporthiopsis poae ATCC 64411]|uniref:Uncharacterized protein n=1 Tax=Magnaporthiopsis poae (strain ATCC 64411 / 73-15) TaxID=644358 RepID=A0A0C4EFB7_MAGP6|nr:hypothetical protein MAPG_11459 [Magnaporthiopsis poae ATCC 64411]
MAARDDHIFPNWGVDVTGLRRAYPGDIISLPYDLASPSQLHSFQPSIVGSAKEWQGELPYSVYRDVKGTMSVVSARLPIGPQSDIIDMESFQKDHPDIRRAVGAEVRQIHERLRRVEYIIFHGGGQLEDEDGRLPAWVTTDRDPTWLLRNHLADIRGLVRLVQHMVFVCRKIAAARADGGDEKATLTEETDRWATLMAEYHGRQEDRDREFYHGFPEGTEWPYSM